MQQNPPPPFKRFARERFDGASVYAAEQRGKSHESSFRKPLSESQHIHRQVHPESRPSAEQISVGGQTPPSYESTVPQTRSDRVRSRDQPQDSHNVSPVVAEGPFPWRLRTASDHTQVSAPTVRQRRQPTRLDRVVAARDFQVQAPATHSQLQYPQLSPYSVMDDVPRSVSQPVTPSFKPYTQQQNPNEDTSSGMTERMPIGSRTDRRRVRSATRTGEASFTDEEFHLFVEATAGLGPEQLYRTPHPTHDALDSGEFRGLVTGAPHRPDRPEMISHDQETPTTTWALQQMARVPYGTHAPQQQDAVAQRISTHRLETSSAAELWLQAPSATLEDDFDVSPVEDDELPTYASSQAQAQAAQRVEAARRAQELQRRWRESQP